MSPNANVLSVSLGETEVGRMELEGRGHDRVRFITTEAYRQMESRPVLSQALEDDLSQVWESRIRAPAFFSNLLPEGVLRELLAQRAGVNPMREFFLLAQLGEDLPGNVSIRAEGSLLADPQTALELPAPVSTEEALRFSIAGLQLKFSVNETSGRWVFPVRGAGGRWLIKLPSPKFPLVPRNEFVTMRFAAALGLNVAEVRLASVSEVEGLAGVVTPSMLGAEDNALLVRRFDRTLGPERIHTEDLLQVLNKHPDDRAKYRAANAEWVGRLLRALEPGDADLRELVKRLVFNVFMGNGDAHLKNWMLRYENPRQARLSPAFDLVSTIQYEETDQNEYALNVGRNKRYDAFSQGVLRSFASKLHVAGRDDLDPEGIVDEARGFAAQLVRAWPAFAVANGVDRAFSDVLQRHWSRIPLLTTPA